MNEPIHLGEVGAGIVIEMRERDGWIEARINGGDWYLTPHRTADEANAAMASAPYPPLLRLSELFGREIIYTQHEMPPIRMDSRPLSL